MTWTGSTKCYCGWVNVHAICNAVDRGELWAGLYLLMKSLHSAETLGLAGKATLLAFSITSSRRIFSWLQPSPKGLLPYSIWYSITPADQTSTCRC